MDDDNAVRASMMFFLATAGYVPRPFAGGAALLASLPTLAPGCVLLDLRMPEVDGFQIIDALAPRSAHFPIVVVTGHGDVVTAVRAMKMGASDFVEKPFEEDALLDILDRLFASLADLIRNDERRRCSADRLARLTGREVDVLRGLIAGSSNKILAYDLGLSIRTIEMHRASMMERLGVTTLAEALRLVFDAGLDLDLASPRQAVAQAWG